jgi:predicted amidohydrolase
MILAAAQTKPFRHNTAANIRDHLRLIRQASDQKASLLLFPELSLTGYERELAGDLAFSANDGRLEVFQQEAERHLMTIIVGAPLNLASGLHIGAFIFQPGKAVSVYTKQFLHEGEEQFFRPNFDFNPLIEVGDFRISLAVCADISNPEHPANAAKAGATLYAAGLFYTPGGIAEAYEQLGSYAETYGMHVLMANYGGPSYGLPAAGQSACWNNKGELVGKLENLADELLIVEVL